MTFALFILIVILALVFDYINGFHDAANAIATVVSTKVLSPRIAVLYGAVLNFIGALLGTEVAATIGKGIVNTQAISADVIVFALVGAILWNLFTWIKGLPTSSSHSLIGGLCGATVFATGKHALSNGFHNVQWNGLLDKVIYPMFVSPVLGLVLGYLVMLALSWLLYKVSIAVVNRWFSKLQILSAGFMAISHGSNDAQKSMGIMALAMATFFHLPFTVSLWIKIACATAMGLGTLSGGWKIIRTMGSKMIKLQPIHGFAAETTAGSIILTASHFGIPLSTTHIISTSIMGVGATRRLSAVKWGIVSNILWAWILTLPISFLISGVLYILLHLRTF